MSKVPLVLTGMMASARALTFALRFTGATERVKAGLIVGALLFTGAFLTALVLWGGR